jgi:hypothetical protein
MADIKEFIKKQTTGVTIGVPKARKESDAIPAPAARPATVQEQVKQAKQESAAGARRPGRPKTDVQKVKLSVYVPEDVKEALVRIQHDNYKTSLNDVLTEAIMQYVAQNGR